MPIAPETPLPDQAWKPWLTGYMVHTLQNRLLLIVTVLVEGCPV